MVAFLLAVPTYWTHPEGRRAEDIIFDHPTPLHTQGTLPRTLESLIPQANQGAAVAVVAATYRLLPPGAGGFSETPLLQSREKSPVTFFPLV